MDMDCDGREIFRCIYNTKLDHNASWKDVDRTYIIFVVNGEVRNYQPIQNSLKEHAEIRLIERLSNMYTPGRPMHVNVYMNNSPCKECALKLLIFLAASRQTTITIYFANLYNIKRKSCATSMETHVQYVEEIKNDKNAIGLRKLMDHKRCELLPFNLRAWKELHELLNVRDSAFDIDVEYTLMKDGKDRSRQKEDLLLQEDLDYINRVDPQETYKEKVFSEMFRLEGIGSFVYTVNSDTKAHVLPCTFNKGLSPFETFLEKLEETYFFRNEMNQLHVNVYMPLQIILLDSEKLVNFLLNHRHAFVRIHVTSLQGLKKAFLEDCTVKHLMDHNRCEVVAFKISTWKTLCNSLGLERPNLEQEYFEKDEKEDANGSRCEMDNIIGRTLIDINQLDKGFHLSREFTL